MAALLEFIDLTRRMERDSFNMQVSGTLAEGDVLAIRGPSGSGKSTLLKMLARLIAPDSGTLAYRGQDYAMLSPLEWRRKIQYLAQKPVMFEGSVEQNLQLPFNLAVIAKELAYDEVQADTYLQELGLSPEILVQEATTLSGGEAARIAIIRSLLINPEILLLDEPTAYLDEANRQKLMKILMQWLQDKPSRAIIIVSHQSEDFELPNIRFLDIQKQ